MVRRFRVYGKKRGHRTTASRRTAGAWEAVFFGIVFLLGCAGLVFCFQTLVLPEWQVNSRFVAHRCVVRGKEIRQREGPEGPLYRLDIQVEYRIGGKTYRTSTYDLHSLRNEFTTGLEEKQQAARHYRVGRTYPCWYNPEQPDEVVLTRGWRWWVWLVFAVPVSFLLIGGAGAVYRLLHLGTSAERRAALARQAARLAPAHAEKAEYPGVPQGGRITESPGTQLAYRLPTAPSSSWRHFPLLLLCLFFNALVAWFLVPLVADFWSGRPDWRTALFIFPFFLLGLGLVGYFVRQLALSAAIGPTLVEISAHPLYPGVRYQYHLTQLGRLDLRALELLLVCEEKAIYRQGTNTRGETLRVHETVLLRAGPLKIERRTPLEAGGEFEVPSQAMHSFKAEHNEILWKLVARGELVDRPDFERTFPVIVRPPGRRTAA